MSGEDRAFVRGGVASVRCGRRGRLGVQGLAEHSYSPASGARGDQLSGGSRQCNGTVQQVSAAAGVEEGYT